MHEVRLVVTDLDNTLLTADKSISKYTADVLNQCKIRGIQVAFATARPERAVFRFLSKIEPDYIISNNGATIVKGSTLLYNKTIAPGTSARLLARLHGEKGIAFITAEVGHCLYTNYGGLSREEGWNPVYHNFSSAPEGNVVKISTECPNVRIVRSILREYPELHLYENSGEAWQQIMHREATKINALKYISRALNIGLGHIAAFGDDYNDIDIIAHCGLGVAVGNAIPPVKQAARFVCGTNNEDGVARWLEANVLK